jgi:signal transduction histidine kinase
MAGDLSGRLEVTSAGDEFDRLAENLNTMLDRIEHLMQGLKDVSDNIAHDLKTPLTRLRTRVEATLAGPEDTPAYRDALEATIDEADQLIRTFNALLMIARVEAGSPDGAIGPIDIATIAADVVEFYEPVAEEAGVALTLVHDEALPMEGSRELISQALANLLDNAIKYVKSGEPPPETPKVTVEVRRIGDELVVSVADNGPGIPSDERMHVLQRFVRLEKSRSQPGSGLGLSLVDAVARLHHGEVAMSDAGPGLVVTLRFPVQT